MSANPVIECTPPSPMPRPISLTLTMPSCASPVSSAITSPTASDTPSSAAPPSPRSGDVHFAYKESHSDQTDPDGIHRVESPGTPLSPELTSLPPFPTTTKAPHKHLRDPSKSFFSNLKASKSSNRVHRMEPTIRKVSDEGVRADGDGRVTPIYTMRKSPGSSPDLSISTFSTSSRDGSNSPSTYCYNPQRQRSPRPSILSESSLLTSQTDPIPAKKSKPRFGHLLTRTRSTRVDEGGRRSKPTTPIRITGPEEMRRTDETLGSGGLRTAPLHHEKDRSFRDLMGSAIRNKSADRHPPSHDKGASPRIDKDYVHGLTISASAVFREGAGAHLMTNLKNTSTKAADRANKASKGIFGKIHRSGSSNAKEVTEDDNYVCKVINLPLVEQARLTRIAKRLEDSKDKTEFWMPALPWRCIDYLNFKGCEEEGLYRVPGSGPRVKEWQRRFDRRELAGDINLFEVPDLYDINIIGSMFKAWLRDLPTEILPKATQAKIAQECAGAKDVPKMLKDELSKLPPWNYYLLFAITCHLSLLHAYVDKNKMNYSNLCICFQPCLKIDSFCFQFLVCDWRNCWQGCWTEKEHLEEEYLILDRLQSGSAGSSRGSTAVGEDSSLTSSQSSRVTISGRSQERGRPPPLNLTSSSDRSLPVPHRQQNGHHHRNQSQLPELEPVMPLSPIGL